MASFTFVQLYLIFMEWNNFDTFSFSLSGRNTFFWATFHFFTISSFAIILYRAILCALSWFLFPPPPSPSYFPLSSTFPSFKCVFSQSRHEKRFRKQVREKERGNSDREKKSVKQTKKKIRYTKTSTRIEEIGEMNTKRLRDGVRKQNREKEKKTKRWKSKKEKENKRC